MSKRRRKPKSGSRTAIIIRGGWVLTLDAHDRSARMDVRIEGGRIAAIGERLSTRGVARVIDARGMVVMPGLVQAHTHVCQTLMRGEPDGMDMLTWLRECVWPHEGAMQPADVRAAVRLGMAELLLGGTTAILDMGTVRHGDVLFEEAKRLGIRYTGGKAIMDHGQGYPIALRESTDEAIEESVRLCKRWHGAAGGRLRYAFSPRSALSSSEEAIRRCVGEARLRGALLSTHAAESSEEVTLLRERTGQGSIEYLHALGFSGPDAVLAHVIWVSGSERRLLQETQTRVVHCPSANLKLGSGLARIPEMLEDGITVALGGNSAAASDNLDGFGEMRLAALVHKARGGPSVVPARVVLRMATRSGARALGLSDVGSIEVGARADLIVIDVNRPHLWPDTGDLVTRLVYAARAFDVHTVLVDGQILVEEGTLRSADIGRIMSAARRSAAAIHARVG